MSECKTPLRHRRLNEVINLPPSPLLQQLGYGTGVGVYKLIRSPLNKTTLRSPWAVKKLLSSKRRKSTNEIVTRLRNEAEILKKLNHPNVIGFRGYVKGADGKDCLLMEECDCSLADLIEQRNNDSLGPFPSNNIYKVADDIANALNYLHNTAFILHGDIKSFNVLVNGAFSVCKICDFGTCLPLNSSGNLDDTKVDEDVECVGTLIWCAPEIKNCPQIITSKADIYSYGLVLWEMLSLTIPIIEDSNDSLDLSDCNKKMIHKRPNLPDDELNDDYNLVLELFYNCTQENRKLRPSANDLVIIMSEFRK